MPANLTGPAGQLDRWQMVMVVMMVIIMVMMVAMLMMIMVVRMRWNKNVDEGCNTRL